MQKKIIALAIAAAVSAPAFADNANMTVYGVLDAAVGTVQHSLAVSPSFPGSVNPVSPVKTSVLGAGQVTGLFNGGISDSRFGIKGEEDLGDGMKAFFVVESGFNVTTGQTNNAAASLTNSAVEASANSSLSGQFFNRQSYVGLSDEKLGSVTAGLNYNPIYDVLTTYDPVQFAGLFSPLGFSGTLGGGGGISESTRVNNSLKYKIKFGAVNVSALVKAGGSPINGEAGRAAALNVGYEDGGFGIQAVYEQFVDALKTTGGVDATAAIAATATSPAVPAVYATSLTATNYNSTAYLLSAKYKMGDATVKAGYEHIVLSAGADTVPTTQTLFGYATAVTNATGVDLPTDVYYVGGDYNLTPATNVAVGYYNVHNSTATKLAGTNMGQLASDSNYASLLIDHNFTKRTDAYFGLMFATFSGDAYDKTVAGGVDVYSNSIAAFGLRHKF